MLWLLAVRAIPENPQHKPAVKDGCGGRLRYIYGANGLHVPAIQETLEETAPRTYALLDDHSNCVAIVDSTSELLQRHAFSAYGIVGTKTATFEDLSPEDVDWAYCFAGYRRNWVTEMHSSAHRSLSAILGRWISRDPASRATLSALGLRGQLQEIRGRMALDTPHLARALDQALRQYEYALSSPRTLRDPQGLAVSIAVGVLLAIMVGLVLLWVAWHLCRATNNLSIWPRIQQAGKGSGLIHDQPVCDPDDSLLLAAIKNLATLCLDPSVPAKLRSDVVIRYWTKQESIACRRTYWEVWVMVEITYTDPENGKTYTVVDKKQIPELKGDVQSPLPESATPPDVIFQLQDTGRITATDGIELLP